MRLGLVIATGLLGCSFQTNAANPDGHVDGPPDTMIDAPGSFTTDAISHVAIPATRAEWASFLAAKGITKIEPPDGLWFLEDVCCGPLKDGIGSAGLAPHGAAVGTQNYQQLVNGWQHVGVKTIEDADNYFIDAPDASLPALNTSSMTIMVYYSSQSTPMPAYSPETIVIAGFGNATNIGKVAIDSSGHLNLIAGGQTAVGTHVYDSTVAPLIAKFDSQNQMETLYSKYETIRVTPWQQIQPGPHGIVVGGGDGLPPSGIWLYMVAWYDARAEMADGDVAALISALGF